MQGLILFAHGSRDPAWRSPFDRLADRVRAARSATPVEVAFLEFMQPDLPGALDRLVAAGARSVCVVPLFLGVGGHLRKDLPAIVAELRARHPSVTIRVAPSLGESDEVLDAVAGWLARL